MRQTSVFTQTWCYPVDKDALDHFMQWRENEQPLELGSQDTCERRLSTQLASGEPTVQPCGFLIAHGEEQYCRQLWKLTARCHALKSKPNSSKQAPSTCIRGALPSASTGMLVRIHATISSHVLRLHYTSCRTRRISCLAGLLRVLCLLSLT